MEEEDEMSGLELRDFSVTIETRDGDIAAVSSVDFAVRPGEVVGLVGESGAGKTMVARAITAMLPAHAQASGRLVVDDHDVLSLTPAELDRYRGAKTALCFQNPRAALSPTRRAGAQVEDRLRAHGLGEREPVEVLRAVGIKRPAERVKAYPHELSGGMAQRLMISLAISCGASVLLADEPTTGLDVTLTRTILELLRREAVEEGRAVLIISHDLSAIAEVCDRICVMYAGTVVEEGPTAQLLTAAAHPYTRSLLAAVPDVGGAPVRTIAGSMPTLHSPPESCPFVARCPRAEEACHAVRPPSLEVAHEQRAACLFAAEVAADGIVLPESVAPVDAEPRGGDEPLLQVRGLDVVYASRFGRGGNHVLRDVDLSVARGETVGVVGESGSGKTTLARTVIGLVDATDGEITFDGDSLVGVRGRTARERRRRMQMVFQDPFDALDPRRTIGQALGDALQLAGVPAAERASRTEAALATVVLDPALRQRRRDELSGGQAQRVGIARALVADPDLLVFDEPTAALDVTVQAQVLRVIADVLADRNRSAIYISHDLATVRAVCDRVVVLYLGRIVESGTVERVFNRPLHPYTRALMTSAPSLRGTQVAFPVELRSELDDGDNALGCPLAARCPFATERCETETQQLDEHEPGHAAACWRIGEIETTYGLRHQEEHMPDQLTARRPTDQIAGGQP